MAQTERRQAIVEYLEPVGVCTYQGLVKLFGVSEMTIRRAVDIKRVVGERADRVVLPDDHSKFGRPAPCKVPDIGQIHEAITDAGTMAADLALGERQGVAARVAPGDPANYGT